MIVKHCEEGWEIVSHYAHGLLAGKIASQLKTEWMPEHWVDVLTGIIEHDDHLLDYAEREYLTENGTPLDFTMEGGTDNETLKRAQRVFSNAMQKSQMIALLIGRHLEFLYNDLADSYVPMKDFLEKVASSRKSQRKLYGINKQAEDHLYDIMLFSDRYSLILCQDKIPVAGRKLEINMTLADERFYIYKGEEDYLKVEPWPFEPDTFDLDFECRTLRAVTFKNNSELKKAIEDAEIRICRYRFKK